MGMPDVIIDGEVVEVEAPTHAKYTWHSYFDEGLAAEPPTPVTIDIAPGNPMMFPEGASPRSRSPTIWRAPRSRPGSSAARSPTPAVGTRSSSAT